MTDTDHPSDRSGVESSVSPIEAGDEAERRADFAGAIAAYRRATSDLDARVAAEAVFRLGRVAWRQGRLDDALELYERARAAATELGDDDLRANAENGMGSVHCQRGAFTQARAAYRVALELAQTASLRARVLLNLGALATLLGELAQARELYERSRQLFTESHDESGLALAMHNLALLHADQRAWGDADEEFARALEASERLGDRATLASVLLNRAEALCAREHFAEALESAERAIGLYVQLGDEAGRAAAFRWQGEALRRLQRSEESERRLKEAIRIAGRLQLLLLEAEAARELGLLKAARGDAAGATKWLRRALARFSLMSAEQEAAAVEEQLSALKPWRPSGEQGGVRQKA